MSRERIETLPREVQLYIYEYVYDRWKEEWSKVMSELLRLETKTHILVLSRFMRKYIGKRVYTICLDCGHYYNLPLYSSLSMYCDCP